MTEILPLDIDPEQIVRWLRAEHEAGTSAFKIAGRRKSELRDLPVKREAHLGDAEREDLSEVATVATLEIAPKRTDDGWLLTITAEDELGPRLLDEAGEGEQDIDLDTFYGNYIRRGGGAVSVNAEVEDSAAKARLDHLLREIETNRHDSAAS
jgi:hypothetical protein